ncbi:MAG TPA: hypothetical protein VMG58_15970, partial [Candidatus Sulfotelmatobacter sp.]|nr:hypothetical protein [Candidatus Sulfotelmatobacter sp.]
APGGMVVIRVPDTTPIVRLLRPLGLGDWLYDAPFHLFDFSPPTLRVLLGRTGFTDVRIFPGRPTLPARLSARLTGRAWGALARGLYAGSGGRLLLPAASKTAIARKPPR